MKKALNAVVEAIKACLNVIMAALCFVKLEHVVATWPNGDGVMTKHHFYYSIYDKLERFDAQFLVYAALAIMAVSAILSISACFTSGKKLRIASHLVFAVSALFFLALLVIATQYLRLDY